MSKHEFHGVLLTKEGMESLGGAVKPYIKCGTLGEYIQCTDLDMNGPLLHLVVAETSESGRDLTLDLHLPYAYVRLIVSAIEEMPVGFKTT